MENNISKINKFIVCIEQDEDGAFVGAVPAVRSCYAEQQSMLRNSQQVLRLCLRNS